MKRAQALLAVQYAGYHGDKRESTRLLIENRISRAAHLEAWKRGASMKAAGIACQCRECVTPEKLVCQECGGFICKATCARRTA